MQNEPTTPVMDVSAPPQPSKPAESTLAQAPPEAEEKPKAEIDLKKAESNDKKKATVQSKVQEPKNSNGVGMAITATVIIVFGLAALATFAYLQQYN